MKKFLLMVITLVITLAVMLSGCTTTIAGTSTSSGSTSSDSSGSSSVDKSEASDTAYTVTLLLPDGVTEMPDLTNIQAKWTSGTSVYTASFNSTGFAYYEGLDGEYSVTISGLIDGYSYNPNIYDTSSGKDVSIQLITLQTFAGQDGSSAKNEGLALAYDTGVYRIEFSAANTKFFFMFLPNLTTTGYTFSIQTYADTIENEICPTFYLYLYANRDLLGGGSGTITGGSDYNGSYTKNIYYTLDMSKYNASSSYNSYIYVFSITSTNNDYPKYLDVVLTRESEYEDTSQGAYPQAELDETQIKEYDSTAASGSQTWVVDICNKDFTSVEVNKGSDGYYYITYGGSEYLLFVELDGCHLGAYSSRYNYYGPFTSDTLCDIDGGIRYDDVIDAYVTNAQTYGTAGYHPVTEQLREFLRNYAAHKLFNDTNGSGDYAGWLEALGYTSNEANQWLYACCFYV